MHAFKLLTVASAAALLVACGGGSDDADHSRGTLVEAPDTVATLTAAAIDALTAASGLQAISGKAACDVRVVAINYHTIDPANQASNASGVMLVPAGACTGRASALVAYAKSTDLSKPRTLANAQDNETLLLAAMYAAQGYTVVASDYLGYAKSALAYHPYLHADSQASTVIDAVRAARNAARQVGATLSGKVMLTGFSQGGHAAMATQRNGERDFASELNIVGGAYLAGPYNLSGSLQQTNAVVGYQIFVPYMVTAWQKVYGDVYSNASTVFRAPYDSGIDSLLPSPTLTYTTLFTSGKLPGINGETPDQARDLMFQAAFTADLQTNRSNAVYLAAKKNDLLGWTPKAQVLLCGGAGDPTVQPAVHQQVLMADFRARGVTNVSSVDVDADIQATYGSNGAAPTDPSSAAFAIYYGNYHEGYEQPRCHAQAKAFFDTLR